MSLGTIIYLFARFVGFLSSRRLPMGFDAFLRREDVDTVLYILVHTGIFTFMFGGLLSVFAMGHWIIGSIGMLMLVFLILFMLIGPLMC